MTVDLDNLSPDDARKQLDAWEAELRAAAYTPTDLAQLADEALPPLIAFARERLWAREESLDDGTLVDLDKLEELARAAQHGLDTADLEYARIVDDGHGRMVLMATAAVLELVERVRAAERDSESFREAEGAATRGAVAQLFDLAVNGRPHGQTFLHDDMEQAAQKILALRAIVRDLAANFHHHDTDPNQRGAPCRLCLGVQRDHREECPGRRAVEAKP